MSTSSTESLAEIIVTCGICDWEGSAADAPNHDCELENDAAPARPPRNLVEASPAERDDAIAAANPAEEPDTPAVGEALKDAVADHVEQTGEMPNLAEDSDGQVKIDVPRPEVRRDSSDPNKLMLSWTGRIELERNDPRDVAFFNSLRPGSEHDLTVTVRVGEEGLKPRWDKDNDYVKDLVLRKSVSVTDVHFDVGEESR